MKIGIDIGGTHTDGALIEGVRVCKTCKVPTTHPLEDGVAMVIEALAGDRSIEQVAIGTTHATNAILQARGLMRVGVLRLAGHNPFLPPCYGWPRPLQEAVLARCETIGGGLQCDGREITPLWLEEARAAIGRLLNAGAEAIAVVGCFAPLCADQEEAVGHLLDTIPHTLSHHLGGIGFIERENAAILNCALKRVIAEGFSRLQEVVQAPLVMTQNNGTIISLEQAIRFPVLTLSAGPTNSFVGGARLAGLDNAIVVDIGGTSTDVGVVLNGFARRCLNQSNIGGIPLNFPMPDVLSIAIGGGSHIVGEKIGPESCARHLKAQAQSFGGPQLTLTDVAMAMGNLTLDGAKPVPIADAEAILNRVIEMIERLIFKVQGERQDLPVVVVGGGASLLPTELPKRFLVPEHAGAANAIGATMAGVSGVVDTVVSLADGREQTLTRLKARACKRAICAGADPSSVQVALLEITPYSYVPGALARVNILAAGQGLDSKTASPSELGTQGGKVVVPF